MVKEDILSQCVVDGFNVKLPDIQLDRKLYLDVSKAFDLIGGKWKGGKVSAFTFNTNPEPLLNKLLSNGVSKVNLKKEFQFFPTPSGIAARLVEYAGVVDTDTILEPSAGQGAIIEQINEYTDVVPDCYELMDINVTALNHSGLKFNLLGSDFLLSPIDKKYTKIIANPPFNKNQDIEHVLAMYERLAVGGRLVSITSMSWYHGSQKKQVEFKAWLESKGAQIIQLGAGAFKGSGTMIDSFIVIIDKK